ncbi:hypothetical protein ES702_00774 [subsurface metagenome]
MLKCLFDKEKECPLGAKITLENMGRFCQSCVSKDGLKGIKAGLILGMLRMFPDEEKAKLEYKKLMKRVEEW